MLGWLGQGSGAWVAPAELRCVGGIDWALASVRDNQEVTSIILLLWESLIKKCGIYIYIIQKLNRLSTEICSKSLLLIIHSKLVDIL